MVFTLPLPPQATQYFPADESRGFQWFAFWSFSVLLIGPWLFCVYRLVTHSLGRSKRIKEVLDDRTAPKTVVVMPVYKEDAAVLIKAIDSVVDCDYPAYCIHVFLSWDGNTVDECYLQVIQHLGIPISMKVYPQSIDVCYKGARVTVSRFKHGGKRHCQKQTFKLVDKVYKEYLKRHDDLFVLFIDSDCILDRFCLQNFMYDMELKPGSKRNMLAMTGIITSTTEKHTLLTILQDMEYVHGQLFERSVESGCGAVTCLPGALTILRFSAFRKMAKYYFADKAEQCDDLFDFGKCHLGEDRWLTHLFMIGAKEAYQIQMCTGAFCKTEAVQTFSSLLKQRRRWFLGFITNEVCMITDIRLWKRYPLLCLVRFMQNTIRTTALLFYIMVISLMTTSKRVDDLPVGFIGVSLGLNYLLMFYFGLCLKRYKAWLYPLMFLVNPVFNWIYMMYGIFTAGQRTWGGPRVDAAAADAETTPGEAVEQARKQGDEFNVNIDTFRTSLVRRRSVPVRPSSHVEGRFAPAEQLLDGFYMDTHEANRPLAGQQGSLHEVPRFHPPKAFRDSMESVFTASSEAGSNSASMPHNIENMMSEEDQRELYCVRQARSSNSMSLMAGPGSSEEEIKGHLKFDPRYDTCWPTPPTPVLAVHGWNEMHNLHPVLIPHIPLEGVIETGTPEKRWLTRSVISQPSSLEPPDSMV
ncbi:Fungal chitin synthase [Penicillium angulare]|uniref:Fungal chitin synthase n=1 Tax=Penicillium angulare TaxID=116970 RepID=UPI0025425106|nr:Fungal chitin synthase [Penicillium angulare]KAJ5291335.1 Fungal chitin synthase [Penicillium angulare]